MDAVDDARESGIRAAEAGATWQWKERAFQAILRTAHNLEHFTSEDVWESGLDTDGAGDGDALGPMFRRVARAGFIKVTDQFVTESKRAQRHNNPKRVWRSLVFQTGEE